MAEKPRTNLVNAGHIQKLHQLLDDLCRQTCRKGYYGGFILEVKVQDGVIQDSIENVKRTRRYGM